MKRLQFALPLVLPIVLAIVLVAVLAGAAQNPKANLDSTKNSAKNSIGMEFVKIAPGEFTMGCSAEDAACQSDEKPAHQVQITKPFEIGKYEVTQAQWMAVMGANPSTAKGDNRPVETVSKNEAQDFLAKLTAMNDGYRYRLPTEAEWEYAARAGEPLRVSLDAVAWYAANSGNQTHPVGQKKPNAWGLYDMLGNVREWVSDLYAQDYYANSPAADPTGPPGGGGGYGRGRFGQNNFVFGRGRGFNNGGGPQAQQQSQTGPPRHGGNFGNGQRGGGRDRGLPILRGGAWDNPASYVRFSARYYYYGPTLKLSDIGFRAVREPVQPIGGK